MVCTVRKLKSLCSSDAAPDRATADIFARENRLEDVAAQWIAKFNEHEARAVAELVNLVIRAAGCHIQIDEDDVGDPDNCAQRINDIQEEYQQASCNSRVLTRAH